MEVRALQPREVVTGYVCDVCGQRLAAWPYVASTPLAEELGLGRLAPHKDLLAELPALQSARCPHCGNVVFVVVEGALVGRDGERHVRARERSDPGARGVRPSRRACRRSSG